MLNIPKAPDGAGFITPDSSDTAESVYPFVHTTQTESGHFKIMDDSPGKERIRTQHRTGTYYEMLADGAHVQKIMGNGFEIVVQDKNVLVYGNCSITVHGNAVFDIKGDAVAGIAGDMHLDVSGESTITSSGDINILSSGEIDITAGALDGDIFLTAAGGVHVKGDLTVSGDIIGESNISAMLNSTAGAKLFSNLGVETFGGLNVGFAGLPIVTPGVITTTVSVIAPIANHGIVNAATEFVGNITSVFNENVATVSANISAAFVQLGTGKGSL